MRFTKTTLAALVLFPGCAELGGGAADAISGGGSLPPFEVLYFPKPGDGPGQALCASGTASYDRVASFVDAENAALDEQLALFRALYDSSPQISLGVETYTAEIDGVVLEVEVVTDASQGSVYSGKLVLEDGTEHAYLDGTILADESAGVLEIKPLEGEALSFVWQKQGETGLAVDHVHGATTTTMLRDEEYVHLVAGEEVAMWKLASGSGILVDGGAVMCWEGGEQQGDFCDAACTQELIDDVTASSFAAPSDEMTAEEAEELADEYADDFGDDFGDDGEEPGDDA